MQSVLQPKHYELDGSVAPLPFKKEAYESNLNKKLVIGYFEELPCMPVTISVKKSIGIARDALKA